MRKIAIYFTEPGFDAYPFDQDEYRKAYEKIGQMIQERGGQCFLVRGEDTYKGGTSFQGGWMFSDGAFERTEELIEADVIFNKGRFIPEKGVHVINDPELDELCTDKWKTYEMFQEFCPVTTIVHSKEELKSALDAMPSELTVAKPLDSQGGNGVIIADKKKIEESVTSFPYLLQEFIDTSNGIPGIVDDLHDFRIITVNGKTISAFVRSPKDGHFIANVSQGGEIFGVHPEDIPDSAMDIFRKIDAKMAKYKKRIYSLDLGHTKDGSWKIIELNSQPGLSIVDYEESEHGKHFFEAVVELLMQKS